MTRRLAHYVAAALACYVTARVGAIAYIVWQRNSGRYFHLQDTHPERGER